MLEHTLICSSFALPIEKRSCVGQHRSSLLTNRNYRHRILHSRLNHNRVQNNLIQNNPTPGNPTQRSNRYNQPYNLHNLLPLQEGSCCNLYTRTQSFFGVCCAYCPDLDGDCFSCWSDGNACFSECHSLSDKPENVVERLSLLQLTLLGQ